MKRFLISLAASLALLLPWLSPAVYAAQATMYLSPASSTINQGGSFTITIFENSGADTVNAVQANLTYSASQLQFISIGNTAAFEITAQSSGGNGSVRIARGTATAKSGVQSVATVTFKALAGSGSTNISFAGGSAVVSSATNKDILNGLSNTTGGTYTLAGAPPPPPPPPPPAGGGGTTTKKKTTTKSTTKTTPPKDTTPPKISNINITNVTASSVQINWTTNETANSEVDYGLSASYGLSNVSGTQTTAHKIILNTSLIYPGLEYHFKVSSTDKAGNTATSVDDVFHTKGASLKVTVLNQKNLKPISGAEVRFGDSHDITDAQGQATVNNLPIGKQTGSITYKGHQSAGTVEITEKDIGVAPKSATFKILVPQGFPWTRLVIPVIILLFLGWWIGRAGGSGAGPRSKIWPFGDKNQPPAATPPDSPQSPQSPQPPPTIIQPTDPQA